MLFLEKKHSTFDITNTIRVLFHALFMHETVLLAIRWEFAIFMAEFQLSWNPT